jgi:hypothetical protein
VPSDASAEGEDQGKRAVRGAREKATGARRRAGAAAGNEEVGGNSFNEGSRMRNFRVLEEKMSKRKPLNDDGS